MFCCAGEGTQRSISRIILDLKGLQLWLEKQLLTVPSKQAGCGPVKGTTLRNLPAAQGGQRLDPMRHLLVCVS